MTSSLRLSGSRSAAALVAGLALAAGLAACGTDSTDDTASDPASSTSPSESTSESPTESAETPETPESGAGGQDTISATGSAGVTEATLLSATEGGGSDSTLAFALDTDQARADFVAQFDGAFADTVGAAAAKMAQQAPDSTPYGATVAIGCEAPLAVTIDAGEAGFEVTAKLPESTIQCLAPVTYVVLFAQPNA